MTPAEQTFVDVVAREIARYLGCKGPHASEDFIAAKLLGMIEERNGASIEEIVIAAAKADYAAFAVDEVPEHPDAADFFRAIARESLGEGKVFDDYAEFRTPGGCIWCAAASRPFSVPRLNIEGAQS